MSAYVQDILQIDSQESKAGKLVVLHYHIQGYVLTANENVYFESLEGAIAFLGARVRDEKYMYDDKEVAFSLRTTHPDTTYQTSKDTFVLFNRDQYEYIKSRIIK